MLNQLRDEVHKNAVDHGWHDEERSFGSLISLMHSELSEALEEYRNGHKLNEIYSVCKNEVFKQRGSAGCGVCKNCSLNKPEGIPIELTDVIIRILDCAGKYKFNIDEAIKDPFIEGNGAYEDFGDFISICHLYLSKARGSMVITSVYWLAGLIEEIRKYCKSEGINIEEAIRIKHEYNKTRPYRHGGKVI